MRKSLIALLLLLPMLCQINGCSDSKHKGELYSTAQVRFLHASPDGPDLDTYVDDVLEWVDMAYKEGSGYQNVPPGEGAFTIEDSNTSQALVHEFFTVEKRTPYSLIVVGFAANLEALLFEDDDTAPDTGNARVRLVHGSPSQPAVDIYITEPDEPLEFAVPTLQNVAFKDVSGFLEMSEGEYQIRITLLGEEEPIFDSGVVTLDADTIATAVVVDATGGVSAIGLVLLTDDEEEPIVEIADARCRLRFIHASPDAPLVDLLLDDTEVISGVQFKLPSAYEEVVGGIRDLQIKEALGQNPTTLVDQTVSLQGGKDYTVVLVDFLANVGFMLLEDDNSEPSPHKAKLRFVHVSPDAPMLDFLVDDRLELSYFPFRGVSGYIEYWAGDRAFQANEAGTSNVLIGGPFSPPETLEEGGVYTYMAVDELVDINDLLLTDN